VFPQVRIRGMFGTPTLYETEIRRVDAARQRIRRKEEAAARQAAAAREATARHAPAIAPPVRPARPLPLRVVRAVLPGFARAWLRSVVRPGRKRATRPVSTRAIAPTTEVAVAPPSMDLETFLRFSVADLFYADMDLDRAMDLLAICELGPGPSTA
ncbi:MAG: hypothetical protein Q7S35_10370, partial [Candidatus Limnocylindrales bacterium]|nr:hypothetical protein [Candidatus Limnocylindrales bacterium]